MKRAAQKVLLNNVQFETSGYNEQNEISFEVTPWKKIYKRVKKYFGLKNEVTK